MNDNNSLKLNNGIKLIADIDCEKYTICLKFKYTTKNISYLTNVLHLLEHLLLDMFYETLYLENKSDGMTLYNFIVLEFYKKNSTIEELKSYFDFIFGEEYINTSFIEEKIKREVAMVNNEIYQRTNMACINEDLIESLLKINNKKYYNICDLVNHIEYLNYIKYDLEDVYILFDGNIEMSLFLANKLKKIKLNKKPTNLYLELNNHYVKSNLSGSSEVMYKLKPGNTMNEFLYFIKYNKDKMPLIIELGRDKFVILEYFDNNHNYIKQKFCRFNDCQKSSESMNAFYLCYLMSINYNLEKLNPDIKKNISIEKDSSILSTYKFSMILNKVNDVFETNKDSITHLLSDTYTIKKPNIKSLNGDIIMFFNNLYDKNNVYYINDIINNKLKKSNRLILWQNNLKYRELLLLTKLFIASKIHIQTNSDNVIITKTNLDIFDMKLLDVIYIYSPFSFVALIENKKRYNGSEYEKKLLINNNNKFRKLGLYGFVSRYHDHNVNIYVILTEEYKKLKNYILDNFKDKNILISKYAPYIVINKNFKKKEIKY